MTEGLNSPQVSMSLQRRPANTGANFNAFGWDPYGCVAYLCARFFGPKYVPLTPPSQYGGPPEPPRYGPPALYQVPCLPQGFLPQAPPNYSQLIPGLPTLGGAERGFLNPPVPFNPRIFDGLLGLGEFLRLGRGDCEFDEVMPPGRTPLISFSYNQM